MTVVPVCKSAQSIMENPRLVLALSRSLSGTGSAGRSLRISLATSSKSRDHVYGCEANENFGPTRFPVRSFVSTTPTRSSHGIPPTPPPITALQIAEEMRDARAWVDAFKRSGALTRETRGIELAFSRSSGPGGQVRLFTYVNLEKQQLSEPTPFRLFCPATNHQFGLVRGIWCAECEQSEYKVYFTMSRKCVVDSRMGTPCVA